MNHDASLFNDIEVSLKLTPSIEQRLEKIIKECLADLDKEEK